MTSKRRVLRTPPPPQPAAPPLLWLAVSLALVPLLLFGRSVGFDYVRADDVDLIAGNQTFLADLANAPRVFTRSYFEVDGELSDLGTYYRPLVVLSFMLDAQVGGGDPAVYHLTNVALHAAVVLLLFGLALRLGAARTPAFVGALLFAVHPLTVQAVCWVVGRNDILLALFALVSLIGLDAALRGGRWGAPLHVTAFALALFTKETGLVLLPACGLLVWRWYGRPHLFRERWRLIAADLAVVALWTVARQLALAGGAGGATPGEQLTVAAANLPQSARLFRKSGLPGRPQRHAVGRSSRSDAWGRRARHPRLAVPGAAGWAEGDRPDLVRPVSAAAVGRARAAGVRAPGVCAAGRPGARAVTAPGPTPARAGRGIGRGSWRSRSPSCSVSSRPVTPPCSATRWRIGRVPPGAPRMRRSPT